MEIKILNKKQYENLGFHEGSVPGINSNHLCRILMGNGIKYPVTSTPTCFYGFLATNDGYHNAEIRASGIQPAISYQKLIKYLKDNNLPIKIKNQYIEFGSYIDDIVPSELNTKLEIAFQNNELELTENVYYFRYCEIAFNEYMATCEDLENAEREASLQEYKYNDDYYVRIKIYKNPIRPTHIGDIWLEKDISIWLKISPLKWKILEDYDIALAERITLPLPISFNKKYYGNFNTSNLYNYINTHFANEILYHINERKTEKLNNYQNVKETYQTAEIGYLKILKEWLLEFPLPYQKEKYEKILRKK